MTAESLNLDKLEDWETDDRRIKEVPVVLSRKKTGALKDHHPQSLQSSHHCYHLHQLHEYCMIFSQQ